MAISTVLDLINRSFRFIHVLGADEPLTVGESTEALDVLNGIIEQANIDKLLGYCKTEISFNSVADKTVYSIGAASTSPDIIATRPVEILSAFSRRSGIDIPIFVADKEDYDSLQNKSIRVGGWVGELYYNPSWPKGVISLYMVPVDALTAIHITATTEIVAFTALSDAVSLPPTYTFWMIYKLGERLSPEYGMEFTQKMQDILRDTEAALKRNNIRPMPVAGTGLTGLSTGLNGKYNIYSDGKRQ